MPQCRTYCRHRGPGVNLNARHQSVAVSRIHVFGKESVGLVDMLGRRAAPISMSNERQSKMLPQNERNGIFADKLDQTVEGMA
ncbi:hypothetical protein GQ53DRAFT_139371 [Thozetella sp. PMI_491]|nr:hypothetical protein GQ53DRAFT_139371 [Thozetella sp. PMI_491]